MKISLVLIATVLNLALAKSPHKVQELEDEALQFIECMRQAMDGGLPSANVPNYNPWTPPGVMNLFLDMLGFTANGTGYNFVLTHITEFPPPTLTGVKTANGANFTFQFNWDKIILEAQWEILVDGILGHYERNGTATVFFKNLTFNGEFDATLGDDKHHLDGFTIKPTCDKAQVVITGFELINDILSLYTTGILTWIVNDIFPVQIISQLLQDRLNENWLANGTRIDAVLDNCVL